MKNLIEKLKSNNTSALNLIARKMYNQDYQDLRYYDMKLRCNARFREAVEILEELEKEYEKRSKEKRAPAEQEAQTQNNINFLKRQK